MALADLGVSTVGRLAGLGRNEISRNLGTYLEGLDGAGSVRALDFRRSHSTSVAYPIETLLGASA